MGHLTVPLTPTDSTRLVSGLAAHASPGESLAPWTSLRVGGPAELLVRPRTADALVSVLSRARAEGLPVHVLGGAQISTLHANWIVNLGGARASDVLGLIERAQVRVQEATGVVLVPEVKRVGVFE